MKKLLYSIIALTGLAMASCTQEHIDVQYNPEAVVAPVLGTVANVDFTKDDAAIEIDYTFADFKVATNVANDLYINLPGNDLDKRVKVDAEITKEKGIKVELLDLYEAILALGVETDKEVAVEYMVNAYLTTDKGAYVANTDTLSNVVTANVKYAAIVAPIMGSVASGELKEKNPDIVIDYTPAEFTLAAKHEEVYTLYVDLQENKFEKKGKVNATFADGKITVKNSDLNTAILNAGIEGGENADVQFGIVASVNNVAGTELMSNVVKATFKSYVADVLPSEKYDKVWVIGNYCGWDHAKTQFLFDYTASGNVYSGVIDFADAEGVSLANTGFKLTGIAGWDDTCNWGEETKATEADEPASIQLITGGGSQDIMRYAKRFYGFEFDKTALTLTKVWSADQIGIIGLNNDWEKDIVMKYNPKWARFYADIEATADTEIKFRADADWALDWGADCKKGGDNIAVAAGKYRVYFNPVAGLLQFNAKAYGTPEDLTAGSSTTPEEPEEPEQPEDPEPTETTYGLIGEFNGWDEKADVDLVARGDGWYVVEDVDIPASENNKFLIRLNDAWKNKFGFAEDNTFVTIDAKNTLTAEGKDMWITDGTFDFYFNPTTAELYVMTAGAADPTRPAEAKAVKVYADVKATGWTNCNAWIWDADKTNYTGGTWPGLALETAEVDGKTYYVFNCTPEMIGMTVSVIFNNGSEQTVDITGVALNDDVIITLTEKDSEGKWLATVNGEAPVTPEPPAVKEYGLAGDFNGWGSSSDILFTDYKNGYLAVTNVALEAGKGFKVRFYNDGSWNSEGDYALEKGASTVIGEAMTLKHGGDSDNLSVPTTGSYDIYFNPTTCVMYVMVAGEVPAI